jgi:hypothetical protein
MSAAAKPWAPPRRRRWRFLEPHRARLAVVALAVAGLMFLSALPAAQATGPGVWHNFNPQEWGRQAVTGGCCYAP